MRKGKKREPVSSFAVGDHPRVNRCLSSEKKRLFSLEVFLSFERWQSVRESVLCYLMTLPSTGKSERLFCSCEHRLGASALCLKWWCRSRTKRRQASSHSHCHGRRVRRVTLRELSEDEEQVSKKAALLVNFLNCLKRLFCDQSCWWCTSAQAHSLQSTSLPISSLSCFISLLSEDRDSLRLIRAH